MIDPREIAVLGERCAAADCHERKRLVQEFAARAQVNIGTVRRHLASKGYAPRRTKRKDAGTARVGADVVQWAEAIAGLKRKSSDRLTTLGAIHLAKRKNLIPGDAAEPALAAFVNRMIRQREMQLDPADKTFRPARRLDWKYPGYCLQVDATNCAQYFIKEKEGYRLADRTEVFCDKPDQGAPIIRYIATDAASGCFRVKYYQSNKERADDLIDFLHFVMTPASGDPFIRAREPMCGIPEVLLCDRGSGNRSSFVRNFCDALEIELRWHAKGSPQAKGSVERHHGIWGEAFESQLSVDPATSIEELNKRAWEYARWYNGVRIHRRHGVTRAQYYAATRTAVRLPPEREVCLECATSAAEPRTVSKELTISVAGRLYWVGRVEGVRPRGRVQICTVVVDANPEDAPIRVHLLDDAGEPVGASYRLIAMSADSSGRMSEPALYREKPVDARDLLRESDSAALSAIAAGIHSGGTGPADQDIPPVTFPAIAAIVAAPVQQARISIFDARHRLRDMLGRELCDEDVAALGEGTEFDPIHVRRVADGIKLRGLPAPAAMPVRAASAG